MQLKERDWRRCTVGICATVRNSPASFIKTWVLHFIQFSPPFPMSNFTSAYLSSTTDPDGSINTVLFPGTGIQATVERITNFKREADSRLIKCSNATADLQNDRWLSDRGFTKLPTGKGFGGATIIDWIFGPFWQRGDASEECLVPSWMCIGWNRKQRPQVSSTQALTIAARLNALALGDGGGECAIGHWLKPFPLVLMSEGQNRIDMYREHGLAVDMQLKTAQIAPASTLSFQKVIGCDLLALHCSDRHFARNGPAALLPFPDLALPVLKAYGVRRRHGWKVLTPHHGLLKKEIMNTRDGTVSGARQWNPMNWKSMLVESRYV